MAHVVIIGAGLTGLSTAYHLEKAGFDDYVILEHNATPGGLVRSVQHNGFTFDYTGHLIHINDAYFQSFLDTVVDMKSMDAHAKRSFIYTHNTYLPFPFQMNLHGLPTKVISDCITGFINRKRSLRSPQTFHDWVLKHFGRGIAQHFFYPYNAKILSYDLRKVHPSWTGRFVPQTTLQDLIAGAVERKSESVGYNKLFYYPKQHGIQHFTSSIHAALRKPIHFRTTVNGIDLQNKTLSLAHGATLPYRHLVSTMPLNKLLHMSNEPAHTSLKRATRKLICNAVINYNLGLNVADLSDKHWIYFPEKKYPFYRLGFWNNFSRFMAPAGTSSLYGEISYIPGQKTKRELAALVRRARKLTLELFGLDESNVIAEKTLHLHHAYVIYDAWRQKNLAPLLARIAEFDILSTGRFGHWKYSSMQEAILDGKAAADQIIARNGLQPVHLAARQREKKRLDSP